MVTGRLREPERRQPGPDGPGRDEDDPVALLAGVDHLVQQPLDVRAVEGGGARRAGCCCRP